MIILLLVSLVLVSFNILSIPLDDAPSLSLERRTLAALPASAANIKKKHSFTVAICAMIKDHEAYLQEWVDYHLIGLQFDNIYLYDNSPNFDLQTWFHNTREHPIYSRVHIQHRPGVYMDDLEQHVQNWATTDCVKKYGQGWTGTNYQEEWNESPKHDYMALMDTDEFMVLQQYPWNKNHSTIHDLLQEYLVPYGGALAINWMYMGTSNHTLYSPLPVTKRFQYHDRVAHGNIKTIVKSNDFQHVKNPHAVDVGKEHAVHDTLFPGSLQKIKSKTGASNGNIAEAVVLLYHYRFMSDKEYWVKLCTRGQVDGANRGCHKGKIITEDQVDHARQRPGEVLDDKAWKFLTAKVPKYRMFDLQEWEDFT
jgi:hypothetical protein